MESAVDRLGLQKLLREVDGGDRRTVETLGSGQPVGPDQRLGRELQADQRHPGVPRAGAPAHAVLLEHRHRCPLPRQVQGSRQPGDSSADHGDIARIRQLRIRSRRGGNRVLPVDAQLHFVPSSSSQRPACRTRRRTMARRGRRGCSPSRSQRTSVRSLRSSFSRAWIRGSTVWGTSRSSRDPSAPDAFQAPMATAGGST